MTEKKSTYSDTQPARDGEKLNDLLAVREQLALLDPHCITAGTTYAVKSINSMIEAERNPKRMSYANENDKPHDNCIGANVAVPREELEAVRNTAANATLGSMAESIRGVRAWADRMLGIAPRTVKGETMDEQTKRIRNALIKLTPEKACDIDRILLEPTEEKTRLQFKPLLNNLSERKHSHYFKKCPYDVVDVYRVLALFGVTDQALGHAIKKLLVAGGRGAGKDITQDVQEAIDTCERFIEMRREDVAGSLAILDLMTA
jgi:hypothetical protein